MLWVGQSVTGTAGPRPSNTPLTRPGSWSGGCTNAWGPKGGCPMSASVREHGSAGRGHTAEKEGALGWSVGHGYRRAPPL